MQSGPIIKEKGRERNNEGLNSIKNWRNRLKIFVESKENRYKKSIW